MQRTVLVSSFGAVPDDGKDDQLPLQKALDSLQLGDTLIFDQPGVYEHSSELIIANKGTAVDGQKKAILRATTPEAQAVRIEADNIEVRGIKINNVTRDRLTAPWHSGIAAFSRDSGKTRLKNIKLIGNQLFGDGIQSSATKNSTSSAGIFLYNVTNFLVQENQISYSLADAIHITGGSHNGRVIGNLADHAGDDGVAVVSYADSNWQASIQHSPAAAIQMKDRNLVTNILAYNNQVTNQLWGRGMSVVGGQDVTYYQNQINGTKNTAGLYIAREPSANWNTLGVSNILLSENTVANIAAADKSDPNHTYHGGIEIYRTLLPSEQVQNAELIMGMSDISVIGNKITNTRWDGIRIGYAGSNMKRVGLLDNKVSNTGEKKIEIQSTAFSDKPTCVGNTLDGAAWSSPTCEARTYKPVQGFSCLPGQF